MSAEFPGLSVLDAHTGVGGTNIPASRAEGKCRGGLLVGRWKRKGKPQDGSARAGLRWGRSLTALWG